MIRDQRKNEETPDIMLEISFQGQVGVSSATFKLELMENKLKPFRLWEIFELHDSFSTKKGEWQELPSMQQSMRI